MSEAKGISKTMALTRYDPGRECWFVEDWIQSRYQDGMDNAAGVGTFVCPSPAPGQYWLVDRVTVTCDASGGAAATLYTNNINPVNSVESKVSLAGELALTFSLDPTLEIGPSESLVIDFSGMVDAETYLTVWYRLRHIVPSPYTRERVFTPTPAPSMGPDVGGAPGSDAETPSTPTPARPDPDPGAPIDVPGTEAPEATYDYPVSADPDADVMY